MNILCRKAPAHTAADAGVDRTQRSQVGGQAEINEKVMVTENIILLGMIEENRASLRECPIADRSSE